MQPPVGSWQLCDGVLRDSGVTRTTQLKHRQQCSSDWSLLEPSAFLSRDSKPSCQSAASIVGSSDMAISHCNSTATTQQIQFNSHTHGCYQRQLLMC